MALVPRIKSNDWKSVDQAIRKLSQRLGYVSDIVADSVTLNDLTASRLVSSNASKKLVSVSDLTSWVAGTTNQISVADDSDGTITLSTPQDIHTGASPTLADLTLSSPSNIYSLDHDSFSGFVANEHIDHTSVTLTASTGLTGGGDISANRSFAVTGVLEDLTTLGAAASDGQFIVATGAGVFAYESGSTARDSLSLGTSDTPQFTGIEVGHASDTTLTRASAGDLNVEGNIVYRAGGTDVPVADGGTGVSSLTAYSVLCGGTTSTGDVQSVASVGSSGEVLTSNGAGALPTWQSAGTGDVTAASSLADNALIRGDGGSKGVQDSSITIDDSDNVGIGQSSFGTSAQKVFAIATGTAPSSSPSDCFQMWSEDFAAGNACPNFRTENGTVITLNQDLATDASPTFAGLTLTGDITATTAGGLDINLGTSAGDDFTIDTSAFVVEGDTGNVGIGTTNLPFILSLAKDNVIGIDSPSDDGYLALVGSDTLNVNNGPLIIMSGVSRSTNPGDLQLYAGNVAGGHVRIYTEAAKERVTIDENGNVGIGKTPNSKLDINLSTEDLEIVDAGSTGATEQDWIEVEVGGVQGYIRVYASK